jgi:hypothetical protein
VAEIAPELRSLSEALLALHPVVKQSHARTRGVSLNAGSEIPESLSLSDLSSILKSRKKPVEEDLADAQEWEADDEGEVTMKPEGKRTMKENLATAQDNLLRKQLEGKRTTKEDLATAQDNLLRKQLEARLAGDSAAAQEAARKLEEDLGSGMSPEDLQAAKDQFEAKLPKLLRLSKKSRETFFAQNARLVQDDVTVEGAGVVRRLVAFLKAYDKGMDERPWREELQVASTTLGSSVQVSWNLTVGLFRNEPDRQVLERSGQLEKLMEIWKDFLTPNEHARKLYSLPLKFRGTFVCDFAPDGKVMSVKIKDWDLNGEVLHPPDASFSEKAKKNEVSEWAKSIFKLH